MVCISKKLCHYCLIGPGRGHIDHQRFQHLLIGRQIDSIHAQKHKSGNETHPFVSIHEWMILDKMVEIRGSHFIEISVKISITKS